MYTLALLGKKRHRDDDHAEEDRGQDGPCIDDERVKKIQ
jgi:hypothetical protein